ncbi:MAG: septum formation initiator family protein [Chitinispirillales bacterium]|jgi:cell division protein FtsB|nr:septum formation initiator family protein [Chitinispirillales bacterium]
MKRKKIIFTAAALLAAIPLLILLIAGNQGFLDMYRTYREDKIRAGQINAARAEIDSLKAEILKLQSDTAHVEKIAREKLGMVRKGETIIKFVEEKK